MFSVLLFSLCLVGRGTWYLDVVENILLNLLLSFSPAVSTLLLRGVSYHPSTWPSQKGWRSMSVQVSRYRFLLHTNLADSSTKTYHSKKFFLKKPSNYEMVLSILYNFEWDFDDVLLAGTGNIGNYIVRRCPTGSFLESIEESESFMHQATPLVELSLSTRSLSGELAMLFISFPFNLLSLDFGCKFGWVVVLAKETLVIYDIEFQAYFNGSPTWFYQRIFGFIFPHKLPLRLFSFIGYVGAQRTLNLIYVITHFITFPSHLS